MDRDDTAVLSRLVDDPALIDQSQLTHLSYKARRA